MKKQSEKYKYGLLSYETENIGDEIQSIAASRFLPQIDYLINRDNIDATYPKTNEQIRLIINGWLIDPARTDQKIHWPPKNPNISPLLISIHIANNGSIEAFKTKESISFLKRFEPIGTRDKATAALLNSLGINAFHSGCLTLTLLPDPSVKKQNFVLAVDISDKIYDAITKRTKRPVIRIDTSHTTSNTQSERTVIAKYWLSLYQSAHCVITPRLHCMLPSLALGTPVIAISGRDPKRYSGLIDLVHHYNEVDFIDDTTISVDHPKSNPTTFLPIRDNLIKICSEYTGYDTKKSYLRDQTISDLLLSTDFITTFTNSIDAMYKSEYATKWYEGEIKGLVNELEKAKFPSTKSAAKTLLSTIKRSIAHPKN